MTGGAVRQMHIDGVRDTGASRVMREPTRPMIYDPACFSEGTEVRIASRSKLEDFLRNWPYHHRLQPVQLEYADHIAIVIKNYMYHGGDILYELDGIPGIWHEHCLEAV